MIGADRLSKNDGGREGAMEHEPLRETVEIAGHQVLIAHDPEDGLWYVEASSVPGLAAEAQSRDDLLAELEILVPATS